MLRKLRKLKYKHDRTLVQAVAVHFIDPNSKLSFVIGKVDVDKGTILICSTSTDVVHKLTFKRIR